uniref:C-type lectin domain-containing protein n=1 Tax=Astyanax mexicanus TaxID=7994 RepID=A0A3B1JSL6_ASTMX
MLVKQLGQDWSYWSSSLAKLIMCVDQNLGRLIILSCNSGISCHSLWTLSFCGTRQFHVVNTDKNWVDAQKYCRENFTDLATIESQEEMNIVKAALKGMTGDFWIGLKEIPGQTKVAKGTCVWMWSDGSIFSYTSWSSGQPDNNAGDNCVTAKSDFGFSWNDLRCYWTKNFVCYKGE